VLSSIVLHHILKQVDKKLRDKAHIRKLQKRTISDDGEGGIPIIMAYMDDVNFIVPYTDVELLLETFDRIGAPLGARMNTEKTRIMTTSSGISILPRLQAASFETGQSLERAILKFSTKFDENNQRVPVEITTGLRVLGVPLGSQEYNQTFINRQFFKATEESTRILDGLNDLQTMLRLFKTCTLHKMTHLFASDVLNTTTESLPTKWWLYDSEMTTNFQTMTTEFLSNLMGRNDLPTISELICTIAVKNGGLGLQHPRSNAIPAFILTTKRCISYATTGVYVGNHRPKVKLPDNITALYSN
jgi:hypothetical protein